MKKYLLLLLTAITFGQTYPTNPSPFGKISINTNVESTTATKISVQEANNQINWLQPINIPIPIVPTNYAPTAPTLSGHLIGIDNKLGTVTATTAGISTRIWFTADQTTITAGTFDLTNTTSKGTAPSHIQSVVNDDNQKKYYTTDVIGAAFATATLFPPGTYAGNLSASTTPNSAQQRWTVELYKCNNAGTPIASGVTGAVVGSLGVTVVTILDSGLLTLADGSVTNVQVSGVLPAGGLSVAVGERIRYHVSAEKVGTAASNITQSVYYGTSYNSFLDVPVPLNTSGVQNLSNVAGGTTTEALNALNTAVGVNGIATVYVETNGNNATGQIGNAKAAFLTIDAALDALPSTGGIVKIGTGSFLSPTPAKIKSYTSFVGQGKPVTNSVITYTTIGVKPTITSPTKLVGGTILLGKVEVSLKDGVEFHNLGVDSGLDYCNTYTAGVAQEGLVFVQQYNLAGGLPSADGMHQLQTNSPPRTGCVIDNVSALCKSSASAVHAMLVENTLNAKVSNVSTYYGIHGLVIKSIGTTVTNFDGHGHSVNGLIFKSNDYAYGFANSVSNVYLTSILTNDCGGVNFVQENGVNTAFHNLSNVNIDYCTYGIKNDGFTEGNNISNVNIYKTQGIGLDIDGDFTNSTFSGIDQREGTTGFLINQNLNTTATSIILNNCKASLNSARGFDLTAINQSSIRINNSFEIDNTTGNVLSGNVYGAIQFNGSVTGTFKYATSAGTEFLSTIDATGKLNKSTTQLSTLLTGTGTTNFVPKFTGANTVGASTISETSVLTTIPIVSTAGSLAIVSNPTLVDNVPRIELNGTTNASPNQIAIRGNSLFFTASGGSTPYGSFTSGIFKVNNLAGTGTRQVVADVSGNLSANNVKITITTSTSITTATTDSNNVGQDGHHVVIDNGVNAINLTCNGDVTTSYGKVGTGAITFVQGSGRTLVQLSGTNILSGIAGSTATLWSNGTTDYLSINNY